MLINPWNGYTSWSPNLLDVVVLSLSLTLVVAAPTGSGKGHSYIHNEYDTQGKQHSLDDIMELTCGPIEALSLPSTPEYYSQPSYYSQRALEWAHKHHGFSIYGQQEQVVGNIAYWRDHRLEDPIPQYDHYTPRGFGEDARFDTAWYSHNLSHLLGASSNGAHSDQYGVVDQAVLEDLPCSHSGHVSMQNNRENANQMEIGAPDDIMLQERYRQRETGRRAQGRPRKQTKRQEVDPKKEKELALARIRSQEQYAIGKQERKAYQATEKGRYTKLPGDSEKGWKKHREEVMRQIGKQKKGKHLLTWKEQHATRIEKDDPHWRNETSFLDRGLPANHSKQQQAEEFLQSQDHGPLPSSIDSSSDEDNLFLPEKGVDGEYLYHPGPTFSPPRIWQDGTRSAFYCSPH